jgi:hypothetical protein
MNWRPNVVCLLVALATVCALGATAARAAASNEPLRLSFDKSAVAPGVWEGTVSGDVTGELTTSLLSLRVTGPVWQVEFDFIVEAGCSSFTTRLSGILNTETGAVVMDGRVSEGYLLGARVHEEGQLVDPATLRFVGTIQLMPATAG